jgi:hypothetical protein
MEVCNCLLNSEAVNQVEADRLNHMRNPPQELQNLEVIEELQPPPQERPRQVRRQRPDTYFDDRHELRDRRRQEQRDEQLARCMRELALENDRDDDYFGRGDFDQATASTYYQDSSNLSNSRPGRNS